MYLLSLDIFLCHTALSPHVDPHLPSSDYCSGAHGQYSKLPTPLRVVPRLVTCGVYLHSTTSPWLSGYFSTWTTSCTQQVRTECYAVDRVSRKHVNNFKKLVLRNKRGCWYQANAASFITGNMFWFFEFAELCHCERGDTWRINVRPRNIVKLPISVRDRDEAVTDRGIDAYKLHSA
jgi:hypothetical protein